MSDLNALYGTVSDGGSSITQFGAIINPSYANDGNYLTYAVSSAGIYGSGTYYRRMRTDLGAARAVSGVRVVYNSLNNAFTSLHYGADGSSWTDTAITPGAIYSTADGYVQEWTFPADITARWWLLSYSITAVSGLHYNSAIQTRAWEITAGTPPQAGVYADWDNDDFGAADDDNITADVAAWRITRGASAEITGGASPGNCTVVLNNPDDDRYNPLNSGGPLYGKLLDGVPLWIGVTAAGLVSGNSEYGLFGGRIASVTPVPQGGLGRAAKVEITCEDALGVLGRTPVVVEDAIDRTQGEIREAILTDAGESSWDLPNEAHVVPISAFDGTALAALEALNKANGARHFVRPATTYGPPWYHYTVRPRMWRLDGTIDASLDAGTDHATSTDGWRLSGDTVINRQKASITPISFTVRSSTIWQSPDVPFNVKTGSPRTIWVEFDDFVKAASIDTVTTGSSLTATFTNYGTTAKIVLTSSGTTTVRGLSVEGQMVRRGNDLSAVADDTTSQAGPRGLRAGGDISSEFMSSLADATGLAEHIVWRYGNPQFRPTLTVVNWMPYQFAVDLFDVIAVTIGELAMTARLFEVVGLTHESDYASSGGVRHTTTYVLQECRVQSDPGWFTVGDSALDGTDILGY